MNKLDPFYKLLLKQYGLNYQNGEDWIIRDNLFQMPNMFLIDVSQNDYNYIILHDICHYIVCSPERRIQTNFGFNNPVHKMSHPRGCGWTEDKFSLLQREQEERRAFALQTCYDNTFNKFVWTTSKMNQSHGFLPLYAHEKMAHKMPERVKISQIAYEWLVQNNLVDKNLIPNIGIKNEKNE